MMKTCRVFIAFLLCWCMMMAVAFAQEQAAGETGIETAVPAVSTKENETGTEIEAEYEPVVQQETAIVLLGSTRYLSEPYLDLLNRYFVKCYSQYRYPTEFGLETQAKFANAYQEVSGSKAEKISDRDLTAMVQIMDKDQVLFLSISDIAYKKWRRFGWDFGSEVSWEAVVELEAILVNRNGVLQQEKFMRRVDEKYTPDSALMEAYTYCLRSLQQKKIFH